MLQKTNRLRNVAVLLVITTVWISAAAGEVTVRKSGPMLIMENGHTRVLFNDIEGAFTLSANSQLYVRDARLSRNDGRAAFIDIDGGPLGPGKAIRYAYPNGDAERVELYEGLPFASIRAIARNSSQTTRTIERVEPVRLQADLGVAVGDARVLGCDGLTPAHTKRIGHLFLAAADPRSRAGVVAGWATHHRGSGIVLSEPKDRSGILLTGRCEYGRLRLEPGAAVEGETFLIGYFDNALDGLEAFADAAARLNDVQLKPIPNGYCTWYSRPHGGASDETAIAQLADFCRANLVPYGFDTIQIDDGWQIASRDFTDFDHEGKYKSGMKKTADAIARDGAMRAGIWYIPFGWNHKRDIFKEHQDWFVKNKETGEPYEVKWGGTCLDATHPDARAFLAKTVSRMSREWGYKYIKIDGLWTGYAAKITYPSPSYQDDRLGDAIFHNPTKTNNEAYRDGLALVREAAGDDVFILGCSISQNMRTLGASFGRVDGMRVGRDIGADWKKIPPCMEMGARLYFLNGRVWRNDPDCLMLRAPLTLDQARAWGTYIALTGSLNMVSEWLPNLPDERLEILRRSMPNTGLCGRPIDLFESERPCVWQLSTGDRAAAPRRDILGFFNWDAERATSITVRLSRLDLPGDGLAQYVGYEFWADKFLPPFTRELRLDLSPSSCRAIAISRLEPRPQVLGTSRHIAQGVGDLLEEKWDAAASVLSGKSLLVAGDRYELRLCVPPMKNSWIPLGAEAEAKGNGDVSVQLKNIGARTRVLLKSAQGGEVSWKIRFDRGDLNRPAIEKVEGLESRVDPATGAVTLAWKDSESVWRVKRDDGNAFIALEPRFTDRDASPGKKIKYEVAAASWIGQLGAPSTVEVSTPAKAVIKK